MIILLSQILAQVDAATVRTVVESTDSLVTKDLKWWFIFVIVVGAVVAVSVVKFLAAGHAKNVASLESQASKYVQSMETQLTEQRAANSALNKQLLDWIINDHVKSIEALNTFSVSVRELAQAVRELSNKTHS